MAHESPAPAVQPGRGGVTADAYLAAVERGDDGLADWLGAQLDAVSEAVEAWYHQPDALALAAESYAGRGLRVFPLTPGAKTPLSVAETGRGCCGGSHRRGCIDALAHVDAARAWWLAHPTANVGLATGHLVDVIDQDGSHGAVSYVKARRTVRVLGVVTTPRAGGVHRYVAATGRGNGQAIRPGLDYRGAGGYVVAPPSVVGGAHYRWTQPLELQ